MSGLRLVFFLLVFANLAFFAWAQGYLGGGDAGREPQRLARQIAPEKLLVAVVEDKEAKAACRLVSGLTAEAAENLKAVLGRNGLAAEVKLAAVVPRFWVHIPQQPNRAAAEKKAAELRGLGIKDFSIVLDEGPNRHALSLALFGDEAEAMAHLQGLGRRGVRSARIEVREQAPLPAIVRVQGPAEAVGKRLPELLGKLPEAKVADCP